MRHFPLAPWGRPIPASITITRLGNDAQSWTGHQVWEAPADPAFPGRGFFLLLDGADLAQNERVIATVPVGTTESGVAVPQSALLMGEGESSVYVENADNHFL